jgi:hypothetical protein
MGTFFKQYDYEAFSTLVSLVQSPEPRNLMIPFRKYQKFIASI